MPRFFRVCQSKARRKQINRELSSQQTYCKATTASDSQTKSYYLLITLTKTLIISDTTNTDSNNYCFIMHVHHYQENNDKHTIAWDTVWHWITWTKCLNWFFLAHQGWGEGGGVTLACSCPCLSQLCQGLHQGGCQLCFQEQVLQLNSRRWGWSSLWAEVSFWHVFWNLRSHAHGLSVGLFHKHTNYMTDKTHEQLYQC